MKKISITIIGLFLFAGLAQAQYDYMYLLKGGAVVIKQSIKLADVDSIVYYEPGHLLTTTAVTSIACTTVASGGSVNAYAGAVVSARGVCWSTAAHPTIALGTKTSNGTATGVFASSITGLTANTLYYVRAYATNNSGVTAYGNELSFTTAPMAVGSLHLGGKIAYLDASGIHGFVCTLADQSTAAQWYNGSICYTGATNTVLETTGVYGITKSGGRKNTDLIISRQGPGSYAASICAALTDGGATAGDWYLPSQGELEQLFNNQFLLGGFATGMNFYWSSTEFADYYAWARYFLDYSQNHQSDKRLGLYVRAVRAF